MTVATFDTYAAAKTLRQAGFNEGQAEAAVAMVRDAITEGVATRSDVAGVEGQLATLKGELSALKGEFVALKGEFAAFKGELATLKWVVTLHTALTIAIAARLFGAF